MRIRLFGGLDVMSPNGEPVRFATRKTSLLFAALVLAGRRGHRREQLAEAIWPGRDDAQARNSLRQALVDIRRLFPSDQEAATGLTSDQDTVALSGGWNEADVWLFDRKLEGSQSADLAAAAELYRGEVLAGMIPTGLEGWFGHYQTAYQRKALQLAENLSRGLLAPGSAEEAACEGLADRLLAAEPTAEAACRALMRVHARRGQENAALRQFELCRAALKRHLGVEPEAQTVALADALQPSRARERAGAAMRARGSSPMPSPSAPLSGHDRPSIAVLPFHNLSGDPAQDYFADGIVEDIVTALAQFRHLFVIARNSSFAYRERAVDIKQIGQELGVGYIVEGSVRKAGERLRITAQLLDSSTGIHLWADRFDGTLADVFDFQDRIASSIVGAIAPKVEEAEIERAKRKPTENLDAYDCYLRGLAAHDRAVTSKETMDDALRFFMQAIGRDPAFAAAYARAARCYATRKSNRWMVDRARETAEALRLARKAVELERDDAVAFAYGGYVLGYVGGDVVESTAYVERALNLNPNLAAAWGYSAWLHACLGEPDKAVEHAAQAMRLSPLEPRFFAWEFCTALAHFCAGRYDDTVRWAKRSLRAQPNYASAARVAAASHALAGRVSEAREAMMRLRELDPTLRISNLSEVLPPFQRPADRESYIEGLRKAGLPE